MLVLCKEQKQHDKIFCLLDYSHVASLFVREKLHSDFSVECIESKMPF